MAKTAVVKRRKQEEDIEEEEVVEEEVEEVKGKKGKTSLISKQAAECRDKIHRSLEKMNEGFYDAAIYLAEAKEKDFAIEWGYDSFKDACLQGEFGDKSYRSLADLARIGGMITLLGLTDQRDTIVKIGWAKIQMITPLLLEDPSKRNVKKLIGMAEKHSADQLEGQLRTHRGEATGTPPEDVFRLSCRFKGAEARVVSDVLNEAKTAVDTEDIGIAVLHIFGEYAKFAEVGFSEVTLEDQVAMIEEKYNVTVTTKPKGKKAAKSEEKEEVKEKEEAGTEEAEEEVDLAQMDHDALLEFAEEQDIEVPKKLQKETKANTNALRELIAAEFEVAEDDTAEDDPEEETAESADSDEGEITDEDINALLDED